MWRAVGSLAWRTGAVAVGAVGVAGAIAVPLVAAECGHCDKPVAADEDLSGLGDVARGLRNVAEDLGASVSGSSGTSNADLLEDVQRSLTAIEGQLNSAWPLLLRPTRVIAAPQRPADSPASTAVSRGGSCSGGCKCSGSCKCGANCKCGADCKCGDSGDCGDSKCKASKCAPDSAASSGACCGGKGKGEPTAAPAAAEAPEAEPAAEAAASDAVESSDAADVDDAEEDDSGDAAGDADADDEDEEPPSPTNKYAAWRAAMAAGGRR